MAETIRIDGRGVTVRDALQEMRDRMQPLEARGFHPISNVEIVDAKSNKIIESFELTDPEFEEHLKSDEQGGSKPGRRLDASPHAPERKEHYAYLARITLEL